MKEKCQNFHNQIRRNQRQNYFKRKRQQFMKMKNEISQLQIVNKQQVNHQNTHEVIQLLQQNSHKIKQNLTLGNYQQIKQTAKDSYHYIKQLLSKSISPQRKNRIIQILLTYNYSQLLCTTIIQTFSTNTPQSLLRQLCLYTILIHYQIFKYFTTSTIKLNHQLFSSSLFICLNQLCTEQQIIRKIFMILFNSVCFLEGFKEQFYFINKNQSKISFNNVFTIMDMKKQYINKQQFHQINMHFIQLYRNYLYDLQSLKKYSQQKQNFRDKNIKFLNNLLYEQILQILQYPNSIMIQKKVIPREYKKLAQEILNITKQNLLKTWFNDNNKQADLMDCILTLKTVYEFFQQFDLKYVIQQASQFLSLIPIKFAKDHLKEQIIQYLDKLIYIDKTNQLTKSLITSSNLISILLTYPYSSVTRLNIFSNLFSFSFGFHSLLKHLNHIIIFLSSNHNVESQSKLKFIRSYFIAKNYQCQYQYQYQFHNQNDSQNQNCHLNYDKLIIGLLYEIQRNYYTENQIILEVQIFINLYHHGFDQKLPEKYYQWYQNNQFYNIIDHLIDKVNSLIQMGSMEEQ